MNAQPVEEDGHLPTARRHLEDAINLLTAPRREHRDGRRYWSDPWYDQLVEACPGSQGQNHNAHPTSIVPFWVDAVELLKEIDTAIWAWQRDPGPFDGDLTHHRPPTPETVRRLRLLEKRKWCPQDCRGIYQIVDSLKEWATKIDELLNPIPKRTLWAADDSKKWAACPQCGENAVYVHDPASTDGKPIRKPALEMHPNGYTRCANKKCQTEWHAPFILCATLGYDLPQGMEELRHALGITDV